MTRGLTILLFLFFTVHAGAQVVYTDPVFPKLDDAVTIYFDATQGNGGLRNCNCNVYIHTGLITSASTNPSDWKHVKMSWGVANPAWQMQKIGDNLYKFELTPSIRQYYGVTAGEMVEQLAFVFRNADGSRVARSASNGDIFYEVYPDDQPFTSLLLSPGRSQLVVELNDTIPIRVAVSDNATIRLTDNGTEVVNLSGKTLEYGLPVSSGGNHTVNITVNTAEDSAVYEFIYAVSATRSPVDPPAGSRDGITMLGDTTMRLVLYAPGKSNVFVRGNFNNFQVDTAFQMYRSTDGARFWLDIPASEPGADFLFTYLVDGFIETGDPYSELLIDYFNDSVIPASTFADIPDYPSELSPQYVTWVRNNAPEYNWQVDDFQAPEPADLVIYEMWLMNFLEDHSFEVLTDTLDYFARLGVNAIELMPIHEFQTRESWGYDPAYHMALEKSYGAPEDFKRFVDECHKRGIAVILDVVYNHAYGESPLVKLYWDSNLNRPEEGNPYSNPVARHPFSVGIDLNHESPATQAFVDRVLEFWLTEYRVDGFRFDLSKGLSQRNAIDNQALWDSYDAGRIAILKHYADQIWSVNSQAYVILEHFAAAAEEQELSDYGMMLWGGFNMHENYLEASMGYNSNFTGAYYGYRGFNDPHMIGYIETHDEERMMFKNRQFGNSSGSYNVKDLSTALDRAELTHVFMLSFPGPKMIWQFGEVGYDYSIELCMSGGFSRDCRTEIKPLRWDYFQDPDRRELYEVIGHMNHLKTTYDVFQTEDLDMSLSGSVKKIFLYDEEMDVAVLGNFGVSAANISAPFPHEGIWYNYFTGDSIIVTDPSAGLAFAPGEYRLYTTVRLTDNPVTGTPELVKDAFALKAVPNPANTHFSVNYTLPTGGQVALEVFDLTGRLVETLALENQPAGIHWANTQKAYAPGMYLLRLRVDDRVEVSRVVVE